MAKYYIAFRWTKLEGVILVVVNLEKQIRILKSHPDYEEVVRSTGFGLRADTLIVILNNGNWFELEFSELEPGKTYVSYWQVDKPDPVAQKILDWLNDKYPRN